MQRGYQQWRRLAIAAGAASLLAACQNMPEAKMPNLAALTGPSVAKVGEIPKVDAPQWDDAAEDVNDNRALGYGLVHMPAMEDYLNQLYAKIKQTAEVPDWPGRVYISSESTLNAHATGAGNIYVNIAVLQSFESEDEIFALLSHEFSHVYLGHQSAFRARLVTESAALVAIGIKTLAKEVNTRGWGSQDNISVATAAANSLILPAWQRSVEEQADLLGATISLRNGYSYASGFKAFLERVADVEQNAARDAQAQAQAKRAQAIQARKTDVDKAVGEMGDSISDQIGALLAGAAQDHADAVAREDVLSKQVVPLLPSPRPQPRIEPWTRALKEKRNAEVLAHYALFPRIDQLMTANKPRDALKLARTAASGATAGDGTAVAYLYNVMQKGGANRNEQLKTLQRNQAWPQRSWAVQMMIASAMATSDKPKARTFIDQQYADFGRAQRTTPDVIGFYMTLNDAPAAKQMALACSIANPRYRAVCLDRSQTDAERRTAQAQSEARSKVIADQAVGKMFK